MYRPIDESEIQIGDYWKFTPDIHCPCGHKINYPNDRRCPKCREVLTMRPNVYGRDKASLWERACPFFGIIVAIEGNLICVDNIDNPTGEMDKWVYRKGDNVSYARREEEAGT